MVRITHARPRSYTRKSLLQCELSTTNSAAIIHRSVTNPSLSGSGSHREPPCQGRPQIRRCRSPSGIALAAQESFWLSPSLPELRFADEKCGLHGVQVALARSNSHLLFDTLKEDLAVADLPGGGALDDRSGDRVCLVVRPVPLENPLGHEVDAIRAAPEDR